MNYIDLVAIVSIGVMAVLFGMSKLYEMVTPAVVKKLAAKLYDGLGGVVFGKV